MGDDPIIPSIDGGHNNANGNTIIHVSNIGRTGIIVLVMAIGVAVGLAAGALVIVNTETRRAEREARLASYYILELDAKMIAAGYKTDRESIARKLQEQKQ